MVTKVMVSFPEEFLAEVDSIAQEEHRTRSELLREALRFYIELKRGNKRPSDDPRVRQAVTMQDSLAHLSKSANEDSTTEIRRWREMH